MGREMRDVGTLLLGMLHIDVYGGPGPIGRCAMRMRNACRICTACLSIGHVSIFLLRDHLIFE